MQVIKKSQGEVKAGTLKPGDVCESASGRVFLVVDGTGYIEATDCFKVMLVELKTGTIDRMSKDSLVRPINLVAREV